jgi:acetyltransferase-like isoleucine patch superfamily enzyme
MRDHSPHADIVIRDNVEIDGRTRVVMEAPVRLNGRIVMRGFIGAYTYVRYYSRLERGTASIGRYCSIAPGVSIGDGNHTMNWLSTHPFQKGERIWFPDIPDEAIFPSVEKKIPSYIGNDVWIGASSIILSGVTVGDGAVVGAGSIVTKDVPPYAVVVGSPARIVRYRFPLHIIEKLLALQWWRFDANSLIGINFKNVEEAIREITRREESGQIQSSKPPLFRLMLDSSGHRDLSLVRSPERIEKELELYFNACSRTSKTALGKPPSIVRRIKSACKGFARPS